MMPTEKQRRRQLTGLVAVLLVMLAGAFAAGLIWGGPGW